MKQNNKLEQIALKACRKIMAGTKATMAAGCGRYEPCPVAGKYTLAGETNPYGQHRIELGVGAERKLVIAARIDFGDGGAHFTASWQHKKGNMSAPIFDKRRTCDAGLLADIDDMADVFVAWLLQRHPSLAVADVGVAA